MSKFRPLVVDLYKRFLHVGHDYPLGLPYVREKARAAILGNAGLTDEDEIARAIAKGRWWVKELIGIVQLRKYRTLKARYGEEGGIGREVEELERKFRSGGLK
jgi:hypothetical protein